MDRRLRADLLTGTPEYLAIDGNDTLGHAYNRGGPGDEAALELLRVQRCEDVTELVVRGCCDLERPESAQEIQLLLAIFGDLDPALAAGEHTEERQQHLVERVKHLRALARVFQILETLQKFNDLIECLWAFFAPLAIASNLRVNQFAASPIQRAQKMSRETHPIPRPP